MGHRKKNSLYLLISIVCLLGAAMPALAANVNFSLTVEPPAAVDQNPEFTLRARHEWPKTIRHGETERIRKWREWTLYVPNIPGCTRPYSEKKYNTYQDIDATVTYTCAGLTFYRDVDGDGYGDPHNSTVAASQPTGYVSNSDDCYDNDATRHLGETWYKDADGDGYSDGATTTACTRPAGYSLVGELVGAETDCDDGDASINPGAEEICNDNIDQNCDGNDICGDPYYEDADQDGFGDPDTEFYAMVQPDGYVAAAYATDCDDNDAKEFPGQTWYQDADGDNYSSGTTQIACERPSGDYKTASELTSATADCDDGDASIYPGAVEICGDGTDQDCSGADKECTSDSDGDGSPADEDCKDTEATIHPGAIEIPGDGIDQNCDGSDATAATCVDLADTPLDAQLAASAPNLMFGLDDSGSMDWEIMTSESTGVFEADGRDYEYVFPDPGDNLYDTGTYSHILKDEGKQDYWKSQWHEYNVIYYNPSVDYEPWSATLGNADPDNPRSHPYYAANYFSLSALFASIDGVSIPNAHYYVWSDTDALPYLVIVDGGAITYYKVNETGSRVGSGDLSLAASPPDDVKTSRSYAEERQNFANWYSYYRKRRSTSVAAIGRVIPKLQGVMVGIRSINGHIRQKVLPISVNGQDRSSEILDKLFSYHPGTHTIGSTPIRKGLQKIGQYYHTDETIQPSESEFADSPLADDDSGQCQQNFAIMFTDGAYNGLSPGVGNVDGDYPAPYGDDATNSVADVAMYYWENDLAPDVANNVPTNFYDSATWQHMVTYTVAFGVKGNLDPEDYDLDNLDLDKRVYPTWPSPINNDYKRIDDLWHSAVNGKGLYLNAKTPEELIEAFEKVVSDVLARIGSGASVSINGEELQEGLVLYQSIYSTSQWTGDVIAYNVDSKTGAVDRVNPKWSASKVLDKALEDTDYYNTGRVIATYDNSIASPEGVPFRFDKLNADQKAILTTADMVNYLRGSHAKEEVNGGTLRDRYLEDENGQYLRETVLADIVHSAPLYYGEVVYAGGNDGMLHAFNSDTGREIFAYVPNLVFENLGKLTDPGYNHKYFVDMTPYAKDIGSKDLLVGGLGKGGKGYYCLDITNAKTAITTETGLAGRVMWEFPNITTASADVADMGYSYSRAFIVNSNSSHGYVAIFGNGYNSDNHDAVLFVVNALTGALIKKISTGAKTACNGLATPLAIDVKRPSSGDPDIIVNGSDGKVDYVYAGDLQGNLWKFDLTSSDPSNWDVAYKNGTDNKPLFTATDDYGNPQAITTKPDAMYHCNTRKHGYIIVFGTGRYLGSSDLADKNQHTIYGIWDYGDDSDNSEYLGTFQRSNATKKLSNQPNTVSLLEQSVYWSGVVDGVTYRILTDNELVWKTQTDGDTPPENTMLYPNPSASETNHVGWFFDLPDEKERIARDLVIRSSKAIVITSIPQSNSPCVAGGESYLMEIDACNGGRTTDPQLDINDDGEVNDEDLIPVPNPPGGGDPEDHPPTGVKYPTMMFPPMIIDNPLDDTELKYFSTSAGNVIIMKEKDEGVGMSFWRHRED